MEPVCKICFEEFNVNDRNPRVCNTCGRSLCEKCINGIYLTKRQYQCPFCKYSSNQKWPKNLQLLQGLQHQGIICIQHKRRVQTLCSSQGCTLPIGICDLPECSTKHKEKGTNVLPISLLKEPIKNKLKTQGMKELFQGFNLQMVQFIEQTLQKLSQKPQSYQSSNIKNSLSEKCQNTIASIVANQIGDINSKAVCELKSEIINVDQQKQEKLSMENMFKAYKKVAIEQITKKIEQIQLGDIQRIQMYDQKRSAIREQKRSAIREKKGIKQKKRQPPTRQQRDQIINQFVLSKLIQMQLQGKRKFETIFDSTIIPAHQFKQKVQGLNRLVFIVQLDDGSTFGAYMNQKFKKSTFQGVQMYDPSSFFWNLNEKRYYSAAHHSINFDFSNEYLLSVGNSAKFDGFWFHKNFQTINPQANSLVIWSDQFENVMFEVRSKIVIRFRCLRVQS